MHQLLKLQMFTLIKQGVPCPVLGSLLEGRVVAMGTDEPFARGVGGTTGLSSLGEAAELAQHPLYPSMLFRTCTELSSRFSETRSDVTNYKNQSICYLVG